MAKEKLYSADEVAGLLGKSSFAIRKAAVKHHIGTKLVMGWVFTDEDIERLKTEVGPPGRRWPEKKDQVVKEPEATPQG